MIYTIAECTVNELLMMEKSHCPKHVVSCPNKFVKLVHLVGFIRKETLYNFRNYRSLISFLSDSPAGFRHGLYWFVPD
jgi:hypothetical protein